MCTHYVKIDDALGAPGGVRTRDRRINNPLFMPLNYGGVESSEGSGGNVPRRCYRRSPASDLLVTAPPSHRRLNFPEHRALPSRRRSGHRERLPVADDGGQLPRPIADLLGDLVGAEDVVHVRHVGGVLAPPLLNRLGDLRGAGGLQRMQHLDHAIAPRSAVLGVRVGRCRGEGRAADRAPGKTKTIQCRNFYVARRAMRR